MNDLKIPFKVQGFFRCVAIDAETGIERELMPWTPNLITNIGLDYLGTGNIINYYCRVGTSNTAPAFTDTQLGAQVAASNTIIANASGAASSSPYYSYAQATYQFGVGVATGNLNELGIGWSDTGATLFSHALTTNGSGVPTTITVLSTEILQVSYEFRAYCPTVDVTGTLTVGGVSTAYTLRAAKTTAGGIQGVGALFKGCVYYASTNNPDYFITYSKDAALGAVTGSPTSTSQLSDITSQTTTAYTNGTYHLDSAYFLDLGNCNYAAGDGIGAFQFKNNLGYFQVLLNPFVPKTNINTFTISVRVAWSR